MINFIRMMDPLVYIQMAGTGTKMVNDIGKMDRLLFMLMAPKNGT